MTHPEHEAEQAYIDYAYKRLDQIIDQAKARAAQHARETTSMFGQRYYRDVAVRTALHRAESLDIGDESLVFGRTDAADGERLYIGRRGVFGEEQDALVVDWRVPAAEPFYRATGFDPMGLTMRRHFLCEGRRLLDVEDEHFGDATDLGLAGTGALLAALERPRTGTMRDIAATIRAEQDTIIRAPLEGILAVQGGPGTGKTAVALHRAAFLLFTHRKKLGNQGILVIGPNRLFLRYIDRVLPALGESGAELLMLSDLVEDIDVTGSDSLDAARVKGDTRMIKVLERAIRDRQGTGIRDVTIDFDGYDVVLRASDIQEAVHKARRSRRAHNAKHSMLRRALSSRFYERYAQTVAKRQGSNAGVATLSRKPAERMIREEREFTAAVDAIWPLLTPRRLLADLLTSPDRLRSAARGILSREEIAALHREHAEAWTHADVPLLDEAYVMLGAPVRDRRPQDDDSDLDAIDTFGHVVADEVQDLTPMALRMLARRARHGSMTLVGDLAQSVGALPPSSWEQILSHLPSARAGSRVEALTINYRTPGSIMDVASAVLRHVAPDLTPPASVRDGGEPVGFEHGDPVELAASYANAHRASGVGTMCLIAPPSLLPRVMAAAHAPEDIAESVSALTVEDAKGLEFDEVVVVEPSALVGESPQGLRALYVALTRATRRVRLVYRDPLPSPLEADASSLPAPNTLPTPVTPAAAPPTSPATPPTSPDA